MSRVLAAVIVHPRSRANVAMLARTAWVFGATHLVTMNPYMGGVQDTTKTGRHLPLVVVEAPEELVAAFPGVPRVAVLTPEAFEAQPMSTQQRQFEPGMASDAVYVLGNEIYGIPDDWLAVCSHFVTIRQAPGRGGCLNVAVAGSIVLSRHRERLGWDA